MDPSRDIIESSKPPRPSAPGAPTETIEEAEARVRERRTRLFVGTVAASAVACAVFTGITAWETHQDRVNTEVIYCTLFAPERGPEPDAGTDGTDSLQQMRDQLGC